ncbi:unnamed protein product [Brassicogethes aeneus]|uniref:MADF domain-containing protein n=1 Tax=Brassicogethes aeneus TaxID=1431903 RepID=A0A9P0BFC7_BRAAE|nr:unnamed protein product [Brassicogethes aeneus]
MHRKHSTRDHAAQTKTIEHRSVREAKPTRCRRFPNLYNVGSPLYKNKEKMAESLQHICRELNEQCGTTFAMEEVWKTLNGLRKSYFHEVKKIRKNRRYSSTLWCFHDICFLNNGTLSVEGKSDFVSYEELSTFYDGQTYTHIPDHFERLGNMVAIELRKLEDEVILGRAETHIVQVIAEALVEYDYYYD